MRQGTPLVLRLGTALSLAAPVPLGAQVAPPPASYAVRAWTIADGIPQTDIRTLALDRDGYLWLGTNLGLTRFDGLTFEDMPRGMRLDPPAPAWGLVPDDAGGLWVLWPRLGVGRLGPDGRLTMPAGPPLPDFRFWRFAMAGDTAWVVTGTGLRRLAAGQWQRQPDLPDGTVGEGLSVAVSGGGVVWVAGSRGLARVAPGARRQVSRVTGLACGGVVDLVPAADGGVWAATCAGVEHVAEDGRRVDLVIPRPRTAAPHRLATGADPEVLWVADDEGVQRHRVWRETGGAWRARLASGKRLDLQGSPIVALVDDRRGGVWVGTRSAGLRHVRRLVAHRIGMDDGLPDRPVHHLAPDGRGGLWIGTGKGLAHWRDGQVQVRRPPALGLEDPLILGLLRDRGGGLWIGQPRALVRVDSAGRGQVRLRLADLPGQEITPFLQDSRGRIWFGTDRGALGYFAPPSASPVMLPLSSLPTQRVWSVVEDAEGGIWVGQEGSVSRFRDTVRTLRLSSAEGLPPGQVRGLQPDPDGSLWIVSYGGGLARWRADQGVRRLRPGGGRFDQMLSAIQLDAQGRFWLFGDGGVQVHARGELEAALEADRPARPTVAVGMADGVTEGNGGHPNTWLDPASGWLWLATVDGVAALPTSGAPFAPLPPRVRVDEVQVDGATRGAPDSLVIAPGARAVAIWFSTPEPIYGRARRLLYRLVGRDRDWIEAGTTRVARYADLPPGAYRFELALTVPGARVEPMPRHLTMRVEPRWWETAPARALGVLAAVAAVWALVQLFTRRLRRRNLELRRLIAERERARLEAAQAARDLAHVGRLATASELATSIAHELNQPLTAIMGDAQRARLLAAPQPDLVPALDAIVEQTERAGNVLQAVREFVSKDAAVVAVVSLGQVVDTTLRLLRQELQDRGVAMEVEDRTQGRAAVRGNPVQLQQVLVNLLLNAAEAMQEAPAGQRQVSIRIAGEPPAAARLTVEDRGPARLAAAELTQMFEPFYSTKPSGLGLGLALGRSIVEAHGGRLWAESPPSGGVAVHMVLPLAEP